MYSDLIGPDLIWLDNEYLNSSPRIAIVGQQIDGWNYNYPQFVSDWSVSDAIAGYREFNFAANYNSSPFWQFSIKSVCPPFQVNRKRGERFFGQTL